jgi:HAE1 family hydrophobic/amphiphilic exporter-1
MIDDTLYDAFGQREIAQYFTQLASYYVIMEVLPSLQGNPATLDQIFLRSPTTGGEVPLSAFAKWTTTPIAPLAISHQGQFPAITISFNLAQGTALGEATSAIEQATTELGLPATIIRTFQGNAQAFQDSLSTVPMLILAVDIAVGGCRRAGDVDAVSLRFQPDRADRHHLADRDRQEERNHDG